MTLKILNIILKMSYVPSKQKENLKHDYWDKNSKQLTTHYIIELKLIIDLGSSSKEISNLVQNNKQNWHEK